MRSAPRRIALERERRPHVHRLPVRHGIIRITGMVRARRHDADDRERLRVEQDFAPEHIGRGGELRAPEAVAENYGTAVPRKLVAEIEVAAAGGLDSEHAEI